MITSFMNLGAGEIILLAIVILLFFGARRIPELMRGIGKGVRSFRQGMNDITEEVNRPDNNPTKADD